MSIHSASFQERNYHSTTYYPVNTSVCWLCGQHLIQPTYLNCKHSFCNVCLHAYVDNKGYNDSLNFPCPVCQKSSAPPWGIWHLSHKVLDRSHDEIYQTWKYEAMCDSCATEGLYATAGRRCTECKINLCDTCSFTHSVVKNTKAHKIVTMNSKNGNEKKEHNLQ